MTHESTVRDAGKTSPARPKPHCQGAGAAELNRFCHLPANGPVKRLNMFRSDILPKASKTRVLPGGLAFEFAFERKLEQTLRDWIAFESQCCPSMVWQLTQRSPGQGLRLEVSGIDPHAPPFAQLHHTRSARRNPLNKTKWVLAGLTGSLVLACFAPIGLGLLLGAALTETFVGALEIPIAFTLLIVLAGIGLWRYWGRLRGWGRQRGAPAQAGSDAGK